MKNRIKSFKLWVLSCAMLIAGVQSASAALTGCEGTVYLKLPSGWTTAYAVAGGNFVAFKKSTAYPSWYEISTKSIGGTNSGTEFFIASKQNDYGQAPSMTRDTIDKAIQFSTGSGFTCDDVGKTTNELWIQPNPGQLTKPYIKDVPPSVKYFFIFLPNSVEWKSATPMISEDGKESRKMNKDPDRCGWYFRRYIDEALPTSVLVHRDDDESMAEAFGSEGGWLESGAAPTPINLDGMFMLYSTDTLYFVADAEEASKFPSIVENGNGWDTKLPPVEGNCSYDLAARIYDTDASLHGAFTCNPDYSPGATNGKTNACFYPNVKYPVVSSQSQDVPCIGVTQGMVKDTLIDKKMTLTAKGKACFGAQADEAFAAMFTPTPGVNEAYCFNMTFNQVSDGAFEFESDTYQSPGAPVKGGFYPAEETPQAAMMISDRLVAAENKRKAEGPIFFCPDQQGGTDGLRTIDANEGVAKSDLICKGPGWDGGIDCEKLFAGGSEFNAETLTGKEIQKALGVSYDGDGWGWSCEQLGPKNWTYYKKDTEVAVGTLIDKNEIVDENGKKVTDAVARWTSGKSDSDVLTDGTGRNQHFCFESHANFRFKKGLKFSFRGDDDIWVFINNKLAVDLGGTHLAAPGYVNLDKFLPNAIVGDYFDIDIYFCDRRTTMSNVHIKTNMYIQQETGVKVDWTQKGDAGSDYRSNKNKHFKICYKKSGGGNCAATLSSDGGEERKCDDEILKAGYQVTFELTRDPTGMDPNEVVVSPEAFASTPSQFNGGIDVSNPVDPIINEEKLKDFLKGGTYYLFVRVSSPGDEHPESDYIKINVTGSVGVANREAVVVDAKGNYSLPYEFIDRKMASIPVDGAPELKQLVPLYIAALRDPCSSAEGCNKPIEMEASPGTAYSLSATSNKALFYEMKNGVLTQITDPSASRNIGDSGVDTVYVTVLARSLPAGTTEEKVSVKVTGSSRTADITFFLPELWFVATPTSTKSVSSDPDSKIRLKGASDTLYLLAVNPDYSECGDACNFKLGQGDLTSAGLNIIGGGTIENGRGYVVVLSNKVYLKKEDGSGTATLEVNVSGAPNVSSVYTNLQFQEPPVPTPQLADIFDVRGEVPASEMNIPVPYFDPQKEYLDGIGDSLVIYYHRNFHKDSLPNKIVVYWESETDSFVIGADRIKKGTTCGADAGLDEDQCLPRIILNDTVFSKRVKTGGHGTLKSWATYKPTPTSKEVTSAFDGVIYDRIAPIIVSARAKTDTSGKTAQLKLTFSEDIQKTQTGEALGDNVLSFYINNGKEPQFAQSIPVHSSVSYGKQYKEVQSLMYSQTTLFPQAGDYVHFRGDAGIGYIEDVSDFREAPGADTLRPANDDALLWNVAPGYDATDRLPSPWVLVTGDVSSYVVRLIPPAVGGIPTTRSASEIEKLPIITVFTYDANKNEDDFRADIYDAKGQFASYGFVPHGWFVKSDMGALIESDDKFAGIDRNAVFFEYELQFFTNLGAFVTSQKGRITCTDETYFGGDCVRNRRNFGIVWNMKSDDNRLVGAGAYVTKLSVYVQLANFGKMNKSEKTETWGVRHNADTQYWVNFKK